MEGLAPQTSEIFDKVTRLECIKEYVLVGGTALSLQLQTRNKVSKVKISFYATERHAQEFIKNSLQKSNF